MDIKIRKVGEDHIGFVGMIGNPRREYFITFMHDDEFSDIFGIDTFKEYIKGLRDGMMLEFEVIIKEKDVE